MTSVIADTIEKLESLERHGHTDFLDGFIEADAHGQYVLHEDIAPIISELRRRSTTIEPGDVVRFKDIPAYAPMRGTLAIVGRVEPGELSQGWFAVKDGSSLWPLEQVELIAKGVK